MGRRKRDGNHSLHKNNLIQDSEGNEENGYPVLDSKKTKINEPRNPIMSTRTTSKKKSCKKSLRILWRFY
jgi:hypothetical protein